MVSPADETAGEDYRVVVNHEEQYSIWPASRPVPAGWTDTTKTGAKDECLTFIETVWTDMRPLSVRDP
ncbi:MAG: MbtH family protein [Solirubrobacteraceae bacterium]